MYLVEISSFCSKGLFCNIWLKLQVIATPFTTPCLPILKLRSVTKSKDWDEYWEFFTAQAKNNTFFFDEYNLMNVHEKMVA